MKVAIAATNASTQFGGEALVPYQLFCNLLTHGVDAKLLTHARNKDSLQKHLEPQAFDRVYFVPDTPVQKAIAWAGEYIPEQLRPFSSNFIIHLLTQRRLKKLIAELRQKNEVDVVHEPVPVSPKLPSALYGMELPVVMGPLNGAMEYPPAFRQRRSLFARVYMNLGRRLSSLANWLIPGKKRASVLLVANERSASAVPKSPQARILQLAEGGVNLSTWQEHYKNYSSKRQDQPTRFTYVGALIDCKAVDLLLEAYAQADLGSNAELCIIGDGPERPRLEAMVKALKITEQVKFLGWLDRPEIPKALGTTHVFTFPSLKDCGGIAILEAMAMHLPVICARWGGPGDYVTDKCGILIEPSSREHYIQGMADAIRQLHRSPELRQTLGDAAYQRIVDLYQWEKKVERLKDIYNELSEAKS